jgi:hypothetical protein
MPDWDDGRPTLTSYLPVDYELRFQVMGGGTLVLGRGNVICEMSFDVQRTCMACCEFPPLDVEPAFVAPPRERMTDTDELQCRTVVSDGRGRRYALDTTIHPRVLFGLMRFPGGYYREGLRPIVLGFHACHDDRSYVPAMEKGGRAVAFFTHGVGPRLHLYAFRYRPSAERDYLVVRAEGISALDNTRPDVSAEIHNPATMTLMPSIWKDQVYTHLDPPMFQRLDGEGPRQKLVRILG